MARRPGRSEMSEDDAWGLHIEQMVNHRKQPDEPDTVVVDYDLRRPNDEHFRRNLDHALKRVGRKDEERARWLLRFAAQDMASASDGQRMDLSWDIVRFASASPTRVIQLEIGPRGLSVPVKGIHQWLSNGIRTLSKGMQVEERGPVEIDVPSGWRIDAPLAFRLVWDGHRLTDEPLVDIRPRFAAEAYRVLIAAASRFKVCARCCAAFIARGRQNFCSPRCSQAVRTRRYRAKHPDKASDARHEAYKQSLIRRGVPGKPQRTKRDRRRPAG